LATIIFVGCKSIAFWNIKRLQIEQHRAWMIRAWVVVSNAFNSYLIRFGDAKTP
jgi:uncharacterized membrane protein YozB (DUF420 family)